MTSPVVSAATQILAHVPSLVQHGSKPQRVVAAAPEVGEQLTASLRTFEDALTYPPNQAFLGALHPRDLGGRPWFGAPAEGASRFGPDGEIMPEDEFLGLLASVDASGIVSLDPNFGRKAADALADHPLAKSFDLARIATASTGDGGALPLWYGGEIVGAATGAHDPDESLSAGVLLENLAAKATATLALLHLLEDNDIEPGSIDYVIGCGEEAVGDRYQRGGGNLAKAVAESAGLLNASGADVKNFCAAGMPSLVVAASLVASGVFRRVAVVAGGSVPKLGMKFQGALKHDIPVLEDVLGGTAALIEAGSAGPRIRLDAVGRHRVGDGSSMPKVMEALAIEPLVRLGLTVNDVDDFATELHNPEVTEPQGSGNVPERNYKTIAALAARAGHITKEETGGFVERRGMPGFAPTQGHIASALCYLPHAVRRLRAGDAGRVMLLAKGSLFLGRMSQQSDGMSVLLEAERRG
ncbi:MAG: glycine/sarcosine/betaine reductase complex component C subunit beta [Actinomycetota bacterium]